MPTGGAAAGGEAAESSPHLLYLHGDLMRRCLQPLPHRDLLNASAVCREWREASSCELIWEERYVVSGRGGKWGWCGQTGTWGLPPRRCSTRAAV